MKEIIEYSGNIKHVVSEPGDATRYDYLVIQNYDDFMFVPYNNTFRYPQKINRFELDEVYELDIAERENCNLFTVRECIRTIKELIGGEI